MKFVQLLVIFSMFSWYELFGSAVGLYLFGASHMPTILGQIINLIAPFYYDFWPRFACLVGLFLYVMLIVCGGCMISTGFAISYVSGTLDRWKGYFSFA